MAIPYTKGPDIQYIRTITKGGGWPDDPDWLGDLTTAEPDAECWGLTARRAGGHPIRNLAIYFAAVDATGQQVAATATIRPFIINEGQAYGLPADKKGIRHPSSAALAAYNLIDPLIVTVTKHVKMGVRVTSISSVSATEIRISIQEMQ